MKAGSWPSILLIYCYGVLGSASLSKLIPLTRVFEQSFAASPAEFALLLSLIALPASIVGAAIGGLVDRVGPAQALVFSAIVGALANILYLFADGMVAFEIIRVFEGGALVGIYAAAPALIMATTADKRRVRAMALWATYTPVGFSTGLLLSGSVAGTDHWRECFVVHGVLFITVASLGLVLPESTRGRSSADRATSRRDSRCCYRDTRIRSWCGSFWRSAAWCVLASGRALCFLYISRGCINCRSGRYRRCWRWPILR